MKKIISLALVLAMLLAMGATVSATETSAVSISTDKTGYEAGETVTVTVTMNKELAKSEGVTAFQFELAYDAEYLEVIPQTVIIDDEEEEVAGVVGDAYADFDYNLVDRQDEQLIKFNYINTKSKAHKMPAGVMFTVKFKALEAVDAAEVVLELNGAFVDVENNVVASADAVKAPITVCPGHKAVEGTHKCACGADMGECADADKNHKCDV